MPRLNAKDTLWFAEKFVSLLIEQHLSILIWTHWNCCDLLKNSYLCLLNNTRKKAHAGEIPVVICWKIRIFAYWTTPEDAESTWRKVLWFAEKFVSLLIEQHHKVADTGLKGVVICWKIRIFAYWTTPGVHDYLFHICCDLLKNSYLCLLNNTCGMKLKTCYTVVICWKIRIFAYWTTPHIRNFTAWDMLWFAEKFVSLLIEQHPYCSSPRSFLCCDLLKNSYLCLLNNTHLLEPAARHVVVICWKIRIFAYWTTPERFVNVQRVSCDLLKNSYLCLLNNTCCLDSIPLRLLWFAEKFVSLLIEQHPSPFSSDYDGCCDLLKNSYLCLLNNTRRDGAVHYSLLWFAEKFVSLLIEQHLHVRSVAHFTSCDLLKNSYLCLLNNTELHAKQPHPRVVICWKIRIFAYWTTPTLQERTYNSMLWFAEKFVSLLIEQHPWWMAYIAWYRCDLLKNSYLCLLNNTTIRLPFVQVLVVICWKIRIFAYWTTPLTQELQCAYQLWFAEKFVSLLIEQHQRAKVEDGIVRCDLLKNSYLCLLNNTGTPRRRAYSGVVICWKIRIFAYWTTPTDADSLISDLLWFAEKFVSLLIEQHRDDNVELKHDVVICWKIRIFAYWTTPLSERKRKDNMLWFAEKFVSLLIEQHRIFSFRRSLSCCDLLKNSYLCLLNNTPAALMKYHCLVVICWKIRIFAYWTTPVYS